MRRVGIFTDGSYIRQAGGAGGYAAIILEQGKPDVEISGGAMNTSDNRMELTAAIKGIRAAIRADHITIFSDRKALVNAFDNKRIAKWRKNKWRKGNGNQIKDKDLWKQLYKLCYNSHCIVEWRWIKAHAGHEYNERCDALAKAAARKAGGLNPIFTPCCVMCSNLWYGYWYIGQSCPELGCLAEVWDQVKKEELLYEQTECLSFEKKY